MKTGTAIVVVGSVTLIAGAFFVYGRKYYNGIAQLQYGLVGVGPVGSGEWLVEIAVNNPTRFTYPVPAMFFNVYDGARNYYGALHSVQMQWIRPGLNKLNAWLAPNLATVIASLIHAIVPGDELNILLDGGLTIGGYQYPLQIPITQPL